MYCSYIFSMSSPWPHHLHVWVAESYLESCPTTIILVITGIKMIMIIVSSHPHLPVITTQQQQLKSHIRGVEYMIEFVSIFLGLYMFDIYGFLFSFVWVCLVFCSHAKSVKNQLVSMLVDLVYIHQCIFISWVISFLILENHSQSKNHNWYHCYWIANSHGQTMSSDWYLARRQRSQNGRPRQSKAKRLRVNMENPEPLVVLAIL